MELQMAKRKETTKSKPSTAGKAGSYLTRKENKTAQLDKAFNHQKSGKKKK